MRRVRRLLAAVLIMGACDDGSETSLGHEIDATGTADAGAGPALEAGISAADAQADAGGSSGPRVDADVPCVDEQFAQLMLFESPAAGLIREEGAGGGAFETHIDATAGGLTTSQSFVYARFGATGLEKIAIGDEEAFASTAWHIALRRYVVRLNSGVSGPSTVKVARTAPMTDFDALASVPPDLLYRTEEYFTPSCEFVPDTSGIGAPATALSSFWSYSACVAMTGNVFVLELPEGRHVKLQVRSYYSLENQKQCDETDTISQPSGAGNLRIRWAFLD